MTRRCGFGSDQSGHREEAKGEKMKAKLQRSAQRHGSNTEEGVRENLRNTVRQEEDARTPLGSRLAARFAGVGLTEEIPELRQGPGGRLEGRAPRRGPPIRQ